MDGCLVKRERAVETVAPNRRTWNQGKLVETRGGEFIGEGVSV